MCGIIGQVSKSSTIENFKFDRMRDTMAHRGPDGAGTWRSDCKHAIFGHRRLAIIDLSPAGHQPMVREDIAITYNGEIYNYKELRNELIELGHSFSSESDTEVLLASYRQWSFRCLEHLSGMFAFAIFDKGRLFAARDCAGEKPFFYSCRDGDFRFASELKALFADEEAPRQIDQTALSEYLTYGYVSGPRSLLHGYAKLPAGHYLTFDVVTGSLSVTRYWHPPLPEPANGVSDKDLVATLGKLIQSSVKAQTIADVPVGILLSGGLDSSLIAAAAARSASSRIKTFTVSFPGNASHDESKHARHVANHLGTDHTELPCDEVAFDILPQLVAQFDEPIADSSMIPTYLVSRLVRKNCTVALGGDGGDEMFGGYLHHPVIQRFKAMRRAGLHTLGLEPALARLIPFGTRGRSAILGLAARGDPEASLVRMFDAETVKSLMAERVDNSPEFQRLELVRDRKTFPDRMLALDFQTYMCDDILTKVDRSSMLASLEMRAPLLAREVVDFTFATLPGHLKTRSGLRKIALRTLAKSWLPADFDSSRKQGFSIPIGKWMRGPWSGLIEELVRDGSPLFKPVALRRLLARTSGNDRGANRVFQLAMLEAWRRHYRITL